MDSTAVPIKKVALVTGASRGIGRSIAHTLGQEGCTVIGTATSVAGAEAITADLQSHGIAGSGKVLCLDASPKDQAMIAMVKAIEQQHGSINVLVNNAGITRDNLFLRMKPEQWEQVIAVNLTGVFRITKACVRGMLKERWGRIITIGSVVGAMGNAGQTNYAATKAGLIGFSKSLALELAGRNITVNVVAPGYIKTDMTAALEETQQRAVVERIPMQRIGFCDEIAALVAFLSSNLAGYITGETININGGLHMV